MTELERDTLDRVTGHLETWANDHPDERTSDIDAAIYCARQLLLASLSPAATSVESEADRARKIIHEHVGQAASAATSGLSVEDLEGIADELFDALFRRPPREVHTDDLAVDAFARAMKAKLAKKRAEGRGGWEDKQDCSNAFLSHLLREHIDKGDPVDVGNLAMMIHQRGERIG